jgi:hypothetical protein
MPNSGPRLAFANSERAGQPEANRKEHVMSAAEMIPLNSTGNSHSSHDPRILGDERLATAVKPLSILDWYRIVRAHHQWTIFQAIRYALWLAR